MAHQRPDLQRGEVGHGLVQVVGVDVELHPSVGPLHVRHPRYGVQVGGLRVGLGDHRRARQVTQLGQRAVLHGPTGAQDADPVAERLDLGQDVAREQHRAAGAGLLAHALREHRLHQRVEARGGLVEQQQLDVGGERGDQRHLLPVPLAVAAAAPGRVEVEALEQVRAAARVDAAPQPAEQVDDLAAGERRPQVDVAGHVGQPAVQRRRVAPRVAAEQPHRAGVRPQQAEQHPDRGRLAGAVGPQEAVHLAGADLEVQPVEGDGAAEGLAEPGDLDRCGHPNMLTQVS